MDWFIIKDSGHIGPYSDEQLHILYKDGDIERNDKVWQASMPVPKTYDEIFNSIKVVKIRPLEVSHKIEKNTKDKPLQKSKKSNSFLIIISFVSIIVTGIILKSLDIYQGVNFHRPNKMTLSTYNKLRQTVFNNTKKDVFDFAISKDKTLLWLVTNKDYHTKVQINLTSIENRVLSNEKIHIISNSTLMNRIAQFDNFEIKNGIKIIDGYYDVKITTSDKRILIKQEFLISKTGKNSFEKKLKKFISTQKSNEFNFWTELSQKYKTIKMLTLQIQSKLKKVFKTKKIAALNNFERLYQEKYGPLFTSFVISNEKSFNELNIKTFENKVEVIANYNQLSKLAKMIGSITMEAIEGFNEKSFSNFDQRFNFIIETCNQKIDKIEK